MCGYMEILNEELAACGVGTRLRACWIFIYARWTHRAHPPWEMVDTVVIVIHLDQAILIT